MSALPLFPTRLFAGGLLSFAVCGAIPSLYGIAIPIYARLFELTESQAGVLLSVNAAGAFAAVIAGILGVRGLTGRNSFAFLAAGCAISAAAPMWWLILVGVFLTGCGFGTSAAVFNRRFLTEFGTKGPAMIGLLNAVWALGAIAAPLFVVAATGRPALVLWGIAAVSLLMIPVVQPSGRAPTRVKLARPPLRSVVLGIATMSVIVEVSLMGFGPSRLIAGGMAQTTAATHFSGFFVAFLLGRLALSFVGSRLPARHMFVAAHLTVCALCLLAISGQPAIAFMALGAPVGAVFPTAYVWMSSVLGPDPRASSGIIAACMSGAIIGPVILGGLINAFGLLSLFHIVAALSVITAVLAVVAGAILGLRAGREAAAADVS